MGEMGISGIPILPLREAALQHACPFHNISDDWARAYDTMSS